MWIAFDHTAVVGVAWDPIAHGRGGCGGIVHLPPAHERPCWSTSVGRFAAPSRPAAIMADSAMTAPRKRTFRKFSYRGVDLDALLDLSSEQLMELVPARVRRKFSRGLNRKSMALIKKLRKAKKECPEFEKPAPVKTHLRNMIIVPEMIGSVVGVYNGKVFNQVEIKPDMVSHYLGGTFVCFGWGGVGVQAMSGCRVWSGRHAKGTGALAGLSIVSYVQ